ncbi:MAG: DUF58 domain-containing protein [Candidatus Melainabacteria bacterium]|nr:DUF58 domain-containing protein [Candidatus Melainabacteria bacterium]
MTGSKKLYLLLALAVIPYALSGLYPQLSTLGTAYNVCLLVLLVVDYQLTVRPQLLKVNRSISDRLSIGRTNPVVITVTNGGASKLRVRLRDDHPESIQTDTEMFEFEIPAGGTSTLEYNLTPKRRGAYQFGNVTLRYLSHFGLFWRQRVEKTPAKTKVFSDLKALHDLSIKLAKSSELGELHQRKRGQGTDFASLREYMSGDDAKAIDWKATARRDRPVIRTYEAEQEQRLLVLLDAGRMMVSDLEGLTRFDHALNAALCLALTGLSHNDQVGIGAFADKPLMYLPPRRGKPYMKSILENTFSLEPRMVEPDYVGMLSYFATNQKGRSLIVVLTDLTDPTGSQALLAGIASLSTRHLVFCVTLKDRQIINAAKPQDLPPTTSNEATMSSIYRRAVATDLLEQRELALSVLQRRGCLVLDCPPQELSDKLVDAYLEVKTRGRL